MPTIAQKDTALDIASRIAHFTNNQWYCHKAEQSVFFATFSAETLTRERLIEYAIHVARLAPQILDNFAPADASDDTLRQIFEHVVEVSNTNDLSAYPDAFDTSAQEVFQNPHLPMIRFKAVNLPRGQSQNGRQSMFLVLSTHALFEGLDISQLGRGKSVDRVQQPKKPQSDDIWRRMLIRVIAELAAPLQIILAKFTVPDEMDMTFRGIAVSRAEIRALCKKFRVRQRAMIYAIAMWLMHDNGNGFGDKKKITAMLAELDPTQSTASNDNYFQFRMLSEKIALRDDFASFVKEVENTIRGADETRHRPTQKVLNAMIAAHRRLSAIFPRLHTEKTFRYVAGYDLDLSLIPPLRPSGPMTDTFREPYFGGTFHRGLNSCVFTPGPEFITFNFVVRRHIIPSVEKLPTFIASL